MVMKSTMKLVIGVVGGVGSAGGLIADFFMPIAPFGFYLGLGLLILFFLSMALAVIPWTHDFMHNKLQSYWYLPTGLTIFLLSTTMFGTYYISNNEDNHQQGWLASNIEVFNDMQRQLGLIQEDVHTIANATKSIDHKMNNVKKETSQNPKKELQNMGVPWKLKSFKESITNGDIETLKMFIKAGFSTNLYAGANNNFFLSLIHDVPENKFNNVVDILVNEGFLKLNKPILIYVMGNFSEEFVQLPYGSIGNRSQAFFMADYAERFKKDGTSASLSSYTIKVNLLTIAVWEGNLHYVQKLLKLGESSMFEGHMDAGNTNSPIITPVGEAKVLKYADIQKLLLKKS